VAVDLRLYLRDAIDGRLLPALDAVQKAFVEMARRDGMAVVPGFTHLQHAQPVCAGAVILAYVEMLERDRERLIDCRKRMDWCPLGACALAGTTLKTDREFTAKELGFANVTRNSIDSVSDRDFAVELVFVLSMIAMHLSRWAEEWILWCSQEFGFLEPDEAYCTGSSIMPQKRNPDVLELIRGKAGGVYGQLLALLTMLKGLPLTYNRDMQDDKRYVFDALDTVGMSLEISAAMIAGSRLKADVMESKLNDGFLEATALAEYLVGKGMAFRQSHQVVGHTVAYAEKQGKRLAELTLEELSTLAGGKMIGRDVYTVLDSRKLVFAYRSLGSAGVSELKAQLRYWDAVMK
jgi:argininosuccinate lyase